VNGILEWVGSLPPLALYLALGVSAAIENIFPPFPADTVVAFGSFLAARGKGSMVGSFLATWIGNMVGATAMYVAGRAYGPSILQRFVRGNVEESRERMKKLYGKYGYAALFLSRFIPGVRSIVPPFAGAAHIPIVPAILIMAIASGIWYGVITWLAFSVGANWEVFSTKLATVGRYVAIVAGSILAVALAVWYVRRRRAAK
jgi:membrane protein DedA with SNARE-associated domain